MKTGKRFRKIALGGTFDVLHKGHEYVLRLAFTLGEKVALGLSTDNLASKIKGRKIKPYDQRKSEILSFLSKEGLAGRVEIVPINHRFGTAAEDPELEAILVSQENRPLAKQINEERKRKGLKELEIVVFSKILAENGKPISSARIRLGVIDREGKLKA